MTIEPSKMEIFENLATSDVATFVYNNLKYFTNVSTSYATTELPLDTLQDWANKRDDIVQKLEDNYVSAANRNQPLIITI